MLNRDGLTGKDIEKNIKVCNTLDVKEDLLCEEALVTALEEL